MTTTSLRIGLSIVVQYEVFRNNIALGLQWYKGVVSALSLHTSNSTQVTVRFEGVESFPECDESFILREDNQLTQEGKVFPFKLENTEDCSKHNNDYSLEHTTNTHTSSASDKQRVLDMERRVAQLERHLSSNVPSIYFTLCTILNKSLKKYRTKQQRLVGIPDDLVEGTWKMSHTCTFTDFKELLRYLQSLSSELSVNSDDEMTTAPSTITISFDSFRLFCNLFSISQFNYKSLLSCSKVNRKGNIVSMKCIGSYINNKQDPARPSMLCVGGHPSRWAEENYFFYKENSHTLNSGTAACSFQQISTNEVYTNIEAKLGSSTPNDINVKWTIEESAEICRPIQGTSTFVGKMDLVLPYVLFTNMKVATKIHKWLSPNRTMTYSSGDSDSSTSFE